MRTIKFRGQCLGSKKWVYGSLITSDNGAQIHVTHNDLYAVDPEAVGQFTGLLDKNEKEAYEGDILGRYTDSGAIVALSIVLYGDNGFLARSLVLGTDFNLGIEQTLGRQFVVGNIHDQPELLKNE